MKYTINDFKREFPTDDVCLDYIFQQRFGKREDFGKYYRVNGRKCYSHSETAEQLHPTAGTIFHKSSTRLTLWFYAIFLFSQSKNGVSAKELERQLGVTYKCAYRIGHQLRKLMAGNGKGLSGIVEADETYYGGKRPGKRGRGAEGKTPVVGVIERKGSVVAVATKDTRRSTVMPIIRGNVAAGSTVMTDQYNVYDKVSREYPHQRVNHGRKEYVRGDVHTNTIEGFWSQLKRSIGGTYHAVSPKHLQAYVNEFAWKYNHRISPTHPFCLLMAKIG